MSRRDYRSQTIDAPLLSDMSRLVRAAITEDLDRSLDVTTWAMIPRNRPAAAVVVARSAGVAAGLNLVPQVVAEFDTAVVAETLVGDGQVFTEGAELVRLQGPTRDLLVIERTLLNFLGRMCGVATLTARYVERVQHTRARLYDTRKTTLGWRRLEKYAVRCGGGHNHRAGLYDAILIKDNHLAAAGNGEPLPPHAAIAAAREFLATSGLPAAAEMMIEIEIDRIEQLDSALSGAPDVILLDNMSLDRLVRCVAIREARSSGVELEASGGINLQSVSAVAETGVDRISVGAITHSAVQLDVGLDWQ